MKLALIGQAEGQAIRLALAEGVNPIHRARFREAGIRAPSVSRQHAEIEVAGARIVIRDLGSSNGTWVEDELLHAEHPVGPGQRIRLGDVELVLVDEDRPCVEVGRGRAAGLPAAEAGVTILAPPDEVSATDSLSWEEIRTARAQVRGGNEALIGALSEAGEALVVPRALDEVLERMLDLVQQVVTARRILLLLSEEGQPEPRIHAARPAVAAGEKLILSRTLVRAVLEQRCALLLADTMSDERFKDQQSIVQLHLRSAMVAPLFDNTRVIGLLYADSADPNVLFDRDQLRVFSLLANLTAVKISNTRLQEIEREKERLAQQVHVAAMVQRRLLPEDLPQVPGYELCARQIPCYEVGGDLYEAALLAGGRLVLAVGDVTGKGIGAALLMSSAMACLRALYQEPPDPRRWIHRIHGQMLQACDELHFVTLFLGLLDPVAHRLEYVSAGHDPAIVLGSADDVRELSATGLPAGMLPGATYQAGAIDIPPRGLVAIYSDGIREAMGSDEEIFGVERIAAGLARRRACPLAEVAEGIFADVHAFTGSAAYDDDATMLLLRRG